MVVEVVEEEVVGRLAEGAKIAREQLGILAFKGADFRLCARPPGTMTRDVANQVCTRMHRRTVVRAAVGGAVPARRAWNVVGLWSVAWAFLVVRRPDWISRSRRILCARVDNVQR